MKFRTLGRATAVGMSLLLATAGVALASSADEAIADAVAPADAVSIAQGGNAAVTTTITVTGKQDGTSSYKVYKDWTLDSTGTWTGSNEATSASIAPRAALDPANVQNFSGTIYVENDVPCDVYTLSVGVHGITNSNAMGAKLGAGLTSDYDVTVTDCSVSDTTAPDTFIDSHPTDPSNDASPTFSFHGTDNVAGPLTYECDLDGTGFTACASPYTYAGPVGDGSHTFSVRAIDAANNVDQTPATFTWLIDTVKPTITADVSPAPNGNGWNNSDVTVTFTCSAGGGSALATDTVSGTSKSVTTEGGSQAVTNDGTCVDAAGNVADAKTVYVSLDKTIPTISGSASPAANGNGWNNTNVTISFTCSDALSGIASCESDHLLSSEGANQSATGYATDNAGNTNSDTVSGINIDKTAPVTSVTGVTDGAVYTLGSVPAAGCSDTDNLSGFGTHSSLSSSGGPVGFVTATCSGAQDLAGNNGNTASATYQVVYDWNGFFQPVDNNGVCSKAKAGSAIPIKFSLDGYQGMSIIATGYPKATAGNCPGATDLLETTVENAGNSSLNYDATTDQYIYVWKTDKAWAGKAILLTVRLIDGTDHTARFTFTK